MYKVVIVEDEDIIRKGLMFTVDWTKYNCTVVEEAVNGIDGLQKISKIKPDIVITDIKMPFKDGLQLLEESIPEYHYEAIIISGYSEFDYAQKAIHFGVTDYLLKPVDMDLLDETIRKAIGRIKQKEKAIKYAENNSNILSNVLFHYVSLKGHNSKYVQRMLEYIEQHYNERISITNLSEILKISDTYLNIKFKEETNYTFNEFLNRYRILQSVKLLRQKEMKIYEVADAVGFHDYKYFISVFKKYIGCSPTKFINSYG